MRAGEITESREAQLLCAIARTLLEINKQLGDLVTLAQQQTDLLRRLLERERML